VTYILPVSGIYLTISIYLTPYVISQQRLWDLFLHPRQWRK
jgi:hypothetical protein